MNLNYCKIILFLILNVSFSLSSLEKNTCERENKLKKRYLLYDVNQGEGFNLRRDVYLRVANLVQNLNDLHPWVLVLPPWGNLYHWRRNPSDVFFPWRTFFEVESLNKWIPVIEFEEWFQKEKGRIDDAVTLQHFADMWKGEWKERYLVANCTELNSFRYVGDGSTLRQNNLFGVRLTALASYCLNMQGSAATIIPFLTKDLKDSSSVLLDHAEILLHDTYGSSMYWSARRSMRFSRRLTAIAHEFRENNLHSEEEPIVHLLPDGWRHFKPERGSSKGGLYVCAHLRRRDFVRARPQEVPSLQSAAEQLKSFLQEAKVTILFLATDAPEGEITALKLLLGDSVQVELFASEPSHHLSDGELAVIDQIICSFARQFIGTHESTFSFRIQEEREVLGFDADTTFHRLCGEKRPCEQPARWLIQYD